MYQKREGDEACGSQAKGMVGITTFSFEEFQGTVRDGDVDIVTLIIILKEKS